MIQTIDGLQFLFGWKHWCPNRNTYVQKRIGAGGGTRKVSVARDATLWECKEMAINLFFPEDKMNTEFIICLRSQYMQQMRKMTRTVNVQ